MAFFRISALSDDRFDTSATKHDLLCLVRLRHKDVRLRSLLDKCRSLPAASGCKTGSVSHLVTLVSKTDITQGVVRATGGLPALGCLEAKPKHRFGPWLAGVAAAGWAGASGAGRSGACGSGVGGVVLPGLGAVPGAGGGEVDADGAGGAIVGEDLGESISELGDRFA